MKKDITCREDIELLVDTFYKQVIADPLIGHFFTEVIALDWDKHIPTMYDFWESNLLTVTKYKGNPMKVHQELNRKSTLKQEHFERWLSLFKGTIVELFSGPTATLATQRANSIAMLMQIKIKQ